MSRPAGSIGARPLVGRGDLLRMLHAIAGDVGNAEPIDAIAILAGFSAVATREDPVITPVGSSTTGGVMVAGLAETTQRRPPLRAHHYAIVESTTQADDGAPEEAGWLDEPDAPVLDAALQSDGTVEPPSTQSLAPPRRMASMLRRVLAAPVPGRQVDFESCVRRIAAGRSLPRRLPRRMRRGWRPGATLVVDDDAAATTVHEDSVALAELCHRMAGGGVSLHWRSGDGTWWHAEPHRARLRWRESPEAGPMTRRVGGEPASPPGTHWLWVGVDDPWRQAGRSGWKGEGAEARGEQDAADRDPGDAGTLDRLARLRGMGGSVHWLRPGARRPVADAGLPAGLRVVPWDVGVAPRAQPLPRGNDAATAKPSGSPPTLADPLLRLMSIAVRVEPALLRALRLELGLPAEAEAMAWCHPDVSVDPLACTIRAERLAAWREELVASVPPALRRRAAALVAEHHAGVSPLIRMEEAARADAAAPGWRAGAAVPAEDPADWRTAARTLYLAAGSDAARDLRRYVRRAAGRADPALWRATPGLAESWVLAEQEAVRAGAALPAGLPGAAVRRALGWPATRSDRLAWACVQRGRELRMEPATAGDARSGQRRVFARFALPREAPGVWVRREPTTGGDPHAPPPRWVALPPEGATIGRLEPAWRWHVDVGDWRGTIAEVPRPAWPGAESIRWTADDEHLWITATAPDGVEVRMPWVATKEVDGATVLWEGPRQPVPNSLFTLGTDAFGLWAELTIRGVTQRFRWIAPGEFTMGSPESEEGYDDERPAHRVRLTEGFWLADTACTQALWLAVVGGKNPSRFTGDDHLPVENVSWDDVMEQFVPRLQSLLPPGCEVGLPTEAQWEYACRAGTKTAFSAGDVVTSELVNFDGRAPYGNTQKSEYRGETVPAGILLSNAWGLKQMHGNVWEWCLDGMRNYGKQEVDRVIENPIGPQESSAPCVVRGGSWRGDGSSARSAYRYLRARGDRNDLIGFRPLIRSTSRVGSAEASEGPTVKKLPAVAETTKVERPALLGSWSDWFFNRFQNKSK